MRYSLDLVTVSPLDLFLWHIHCVPNFFTSRLIAARALLLYPPPPNSDEWFNWWYLILVFPKVVTMYKVLSDYRIPPQGGIWVLSCDTRRNMQSRIPQTSDISAHIARISRLPSVFRFRIHCVRRMRRDRILWVFRCHCLFQHYRSTYIKRTSSRDKQVPMNQDRSDTVSILFQCTKQTRNHMFDTPLP